MRALTRSQQRQVREHLGHGRGDRVVTIHRDGTVTYIGSLDGFDYDKHRVRLLGGNADELLLEAVVQAKVIEARKKGRYPKTRWWTPDLVE